MIQHGRPEWLGRQHFDTWFPNWKVAVEYHGTQHFQPVEFFGGLQSFEQTVERDAAKVRKAENNGVALLVVKEGYDFDALAKDIRMYSRKRAISIP